MSKSQEDNSAWSTSPVREQSWSGVIIGAILLVGLGIGVVAVVIWLWKSIESSDSVVLAAVITGSATVLVSTAGIVLGRRNERKNEFEQRRQEKRIPVYEQFVDFWFRRVLYASKTGGEPMNEQELNEFFAAFTRDLMIWGSDNVIMKWSELRNQWSRLSSDRSRDGSIKAMLEFEQLLLAMRRDIGYPETALPPRSLLGLFINDVDTLNVPDSD